MIARVIQVGNPETNRMGREIPFGAIIDEAPDPDPIETARAIARRIMLFTDLSFFPRNSTE